MLLKLGKYEIGYENAIKFFNGLLIERKSGKVNYKMYNTLIPYQI